MSTDPQGRSGEATTLSFENCVFCKDGLLVGGSRGREDRQEPPHLQDGCSCVVDGQDVGDVVLGQQLSVLCICGAQEKIKQFKAANHGSPRLGPELNKAFSARRQTPPPIPEEPSKQIWLQSFTLVLN